MDTIDSLSDLSDSALHQHGLASACALDKCTYRVGMALLAVERRRLFLQHGCNSTVSYAARLLGLHPMKASELLRVCRALGKLPALQAAFRTGVLGWSKVREISRVACSESEEEWLEFARQHTAQEVQRAVTVSPRSYKQSLAAEAQGVELWNQKAPATPGPVPLVVAKPAPAATPVVAAPTRPAAPEGRRIRLTFDLTPEQYARYEKAEEQVRRQAGRRLGRTEILMRFVAARLADVSAEGLQKIPVVVRVDGATGEGCFETGRGPIPATPAQVDQALAEAKAILVTTEEPRLFKEEPAPEPRRAPSKRKKVSRSILRALMARAGGRCEKCGGTGPFEVHHVTAVSRGGQNLLSGLRLYCACCHDLDHQKDFQPGTPWHRARERQRARRPRDGPSQDADHKLP